MSEHVFRPMQVKGNSYKVTGKKPFTPDGVIKPSTLEIVTRFAFDMTFGSKGQHRDHRTGGSAHRSTGQILTDTFQGKLSEFALANLLYKQEGFEKPDTSTYSLGKWESADFEIGKNLLSVKSTKYYGNLLLLEKGDWDTGGNYIPTGDKPKNYSHIVLVRVAPDIEELIRPRSSYSPSSYEGVLKAVLGQAWKYEITGFITSGDLQRIMGLGHEIPKGALLNGSVQMDASNYYVQASDLRSPKDLLATLK